MIIVFKSSSLLADTLATLCQFLSNVLILVLSFCCVHFPRRAIVKGEASTGEMSVGLRAEAATT